MKKKPQVEGVQRGISYTTGYLMRPHGENSCEFIYITHSDPRGKISLVSFTFLGKIPSWVVNATVKMVAPMITKRLYEAACNYAAWKATHNPDFKPWSNFQQLQEFPRLDPADIETFDSSVISKIADEEEVPDKSVLPPPHSSKDLEL